MGSLHLMGEVNDNQNEQWLISDTDGIKIADSWKASVAMSLYAPGKLVRELSPSHPLRKILTICLSHLTPHPLQILFGQESTHTGIVHVWACVSL